MNQPTNNWINLTKCPGCASHDYIDCGVLPGLAYYFGDAEIRFPPDGIRVAKCRNCFLCFKTTVPSPYFLTEVFIRQAGNVWNDDYNFVYETELIEQFVKKVNFDLLDVGPSNGALLKALSDISGRKSGLDVVEHPGLKKYLNGEFIHGLLDDVNISWSGDVYDVITTYDVFEHFYNPDLAFSNLNLLLKPGGLVVIETGDINSYRPKKYGVREWWYVNLFEHHIFWQKNSILYFAEKYGFEVLFMKEVRHKSWRGRSLLNKLIQILKVITWKLSSSLYKKIAIKMNMRGVTSPWSTLLVDHLVVILRKI